MSTKQQQTLHNLNSEITERRAYLKQTEEDIAAVVDAGNNQIRELTIEVDTLENQKANLLRELLSINARIRERKRLAEIA